MGSQRGGHNWVTNTSIPFMRAPPSWSYVCVRVHVCVSCSVASDSFVTPWTVACHVSLSVEFSKQEYCSGLPFPFLGDLPYPGIESESPALQADSLQSEPLGGPWSYLTHPNYTSQSDFLKLPHCDVGFQHLNLKGTQPFSPLQWATGEKTHTPWFR